MCSGSPPLFRCPSRCYAILSRHWRGREWHRQPCGRTSPPFVTPRLCADTRGRGSYLLSPACVWSRMGPGHPPTRRRLPIIPAILRQTRPPATRRPVTASYQETMLWAAATVYFFGFFRAGEITVPLSSAFDARVHLCWGDAERRPEPSSAERHLITCRLQIVVFVSWH